MNFYSCHCHDMASNQFFLDSTSKPEDLIRRARELQYSGLAITNHASVSSYISYLKIRDKLKAEGSDFKIMFGVEAYLIDESEYKNTRDFYHAIIIAKDLIGLRQIFKLVSVSNKRSYFERGVRRVPVFYQDVDALEEKGHLIFSSACLGSRISKQILAHNVQGVRDFLSWLDGAFGKENLFLEIQPNNHSPEQKIVNDTILKLSRQTGIPYIITTDSHYTLKSEAPIHQAFLNSRDAKGFRETSPFYDFTYLLDQNEFYEVLGSMGMSEEEIRIGLENTALLADRVEEFDFRHHLIIPQVKIPFFKIHDLFKDYYDKYPFIEKFAHSSEEQNKYMIYCMEERVLEKGYTFGDVEMERINTELEVLDGISEYHKQPMSAYLNLVKRIVDLIWKVSPVMPGRGSCSGFLCCYWLGITQLNPLDYNLPWFRFLNLGRIDDTPDIDVDSSAVCEDQIIALLKEEFGEDCVLHTMTYKTESLKSAILTACRGLGINNDEAQEMSALVPLKRGKMPTLKGIENGDEDIDTPPVPELINKLRAHEGLYEAVDKIQGLWSGTGIHASSIYIFQNGYLAQNALAIAPNGVETTAFDMHDSDDMGALKFDLLKTKPPQLFAKCMEYMVKDGVIEWQGSLRATWDKYFHPSVVDYNCKELWDNAADGKVLSLFQFGDSPSGSITIKKIRPTSLVEMAMANDVMRLQGTIDGETPTDRFVRYKNYPEQAIDEMHEYGLNDREIELVERHFGESYTVSNEQEQLMGCWLDPEISNLPLRTVNQYRKILAKKQVNKIPAMKEEFFEAGRKCGNRDVFLNFVWERLCLPQLAYSFSRNHSVAYSAIGAIESWLVTKYNPLYWDAAVLSVQAGGEAQTDSTMEEVLFGDEDEETEETQDSQDKRVNTTDYGKIARGIGLVQGHGVKVSLPQVNKADWDFKPDITSDSIIFGFGGITGVNPELASRIIAARTTQLFTSLTDFLTRINPTKVQMINMIKAGCFDELYQPQMVNMIGATAHTAPQQPEVNRAHIMGDYVSYLANQSVSRKEKLTMANFEKLVSYDLLPASHEISRRVWRYKKFMEEHCYDKENKRFLLTAQNTLKFFNEYYADNLTLGKDYDTIPSGYAVKKAAFTRVTNKYMDDLKVWLASDEACDLFYRAEKQKAFNDVWDKYCTGSVSHWEMQSLHYYYHEHELAHVNTSRYRIVDFDSLPEAPTVLGTKKGRDGQGIPVYDVKAICGTVINSDNNKHIVTLLTHNGKVVDVKFYAGSYIYYNKVLSVIDEKGTKHRIEGSWFDRGTLLLISGVRRELSFLPKTDWSKGFKHSVQLITRVNEDGSLTLKEDREKI